jgi:hypothetical protein
MSATNKHPSRPKGQKRQALRHEVVLASPLALLSSPPPHLRPRRLSLSLSLISSTMQAISRAFPFLSFPRRPARPALSVLASSQQGHRPMQAGKQTNDSVHACLPAVVRIRNSELRGLTLRSKSGGGLGLAGQCEKRRGGAEMLARNTESYEILCFFLLWRETELSIRVTRAHAHGNTPVGLFVC